MLGIEYTIFEYRNGIKKPIMDWRASPGNIPEGLQLLKKKFGEDFDELRKTANENTKRIMHR